MMKKSVWAILVFMVLLPAGPAAASKLSATARVDRTRISIEDSVSLKVIVEGGDGEVDIASIRDFDVISSATQNSRSYINGTWKHEMIYQYYLAPKKTGTLRIPALKVTAGKEEALTEEILIECGEAKALSVRGQGFSAVAELDDSRAVEGQEIVYTLRLFASERFAGADFTPPAFEGLSAKALTEWKKYTRTQNGQAVVVNEIKYLIQAGKPGRYEIEPAVFTVREAVESAGRQDPFDSFFNDPFFNRVRTRPVRVASNRLALTVAPLPPYTGTGRFSGLVGTFTLAAALDKNRVKTGDSATLTLTVKGRGNVADVGTLAPELPEDRFKVYKDAPVEDIQATDDGMAGEKVFKLALVPKTPGPATIPAVTLTYFDTKAQAYKTASTAPLTLEVLPGTEASSPVSPGAGSPEKTPNRPAKVAQKEVALMNRDILEIREDISAIRGVSRMSTPSFLFWLALPGLGFALAAWGLRRRDREPDVRERGQAKVRQLIRKAEGSGPDHPDFLPALQSALTTLILSRGGRSGETLTHEEARTLLESVDPETAETVLSTMTVLDRARFGGGRLDRDTAAECLNRIKTLAKHLVVLAAAAVTLAAAPATVRAQESAARFVDAVRNYKASRYEQAAREFEAIARDGAENPDLYYNTGNAYLRAKDLGRAILWYERARRLSPRDPDIRFNLDHARSRVVDKIEPSFSLWDILFFWKGWIPLKSLQVAAITGSFIFFAWAGIRLGFRRKIITASGLALFSLFLALSLFALLEGAGVGSQARAVILSPRVAVRSGTMETATALFDLHAGAKVKVLEKRGDYIKIGIAGDKVGWVALKDAGII